MGKIVVFIGSVVAMNDGRTQDARRKVEFDGEELGTHREYGTGRNGALTDTRGITRTLYRADDGRLLVHVENWSRWVSEPNTEALYEATEADLQPGGRFEALGCACGFGRSLTVEEALQRSGKSEVSLVDLVSGAEMHLRCLYGFDIGLDAEQKQRLEALDFDFERWGGTLDALNAELAPVIFEVLGGLENGV